MLRNPDAPEPEGALSHWRMVVVRARAFARVRSSESGVGTANLWNRGSVMVSVAVFHKGKLLERPTDITPPTPASDGDRNSGTEVA